MTDKHRQRRHLVPQGFLPNWVLVAFAAASIVLVKLAHSLA